MNNQFSRTALLLGEAAIERLNAAHVAIFGLGGVGGYVVEALARSGIGRLTLVDDDKISVSNINRQLLATWDTVGQDKADTAAARVHAINPACQIIVRKTFYTPETAPSFDFREYDYIVDAIDTVTGKLELVTRANAAGTPIISSMGTGNKLDPTAFVVTDITKTNTCPLARIMRKELKKHGIPHLKVVYSTETALEPVAELEAAVLEESRQEEADGERGTFTRRQIPGSTAFVPAAAGLIAASAVVGDLLAL